MTIETMCDMTVSIEVGDNCIDVDVNYNYTPGRPEQGPSYYSGGEPEESAEVEVVTTCVHYKGTSVPTTNWFWEAIEDYVVDYILEHHEDWKSEPEYEHEKLTGVYNK